jgi:hypothetical protein
VHLLARVSSTSGNVQGIALDNTVGGIDVTRNIVCDWSFDGVTNKTLVNSGAVGAIQIFSNVRVEGVVNTGGGSGYVNGNYSNVPLTGGSGTGALATIVAAGSVVTSVNTDNAPGSGYTAGNVLSASNANLGGSGSGLALTVGNVVVGTNTTTGNTCKRQIATGSEVQIPERPRYMTAPFSVARDTCRLR